MKTIKYAFAGSGLMMAFVVFCDLVTFTMNQDRIAGTVIVILVGGILGIGCSKIESNLK